MRNALLAGTFVALACGVAGWFVVLRGQVFAGDALSHVAFPGALAAAAAGVDQRIGLFVATVAVGVAIGAAGPRRVRARLAPPAVVAGGRHDDRRRVHVRAGPRRVLSRAREHELGGRLGHRRRAHAVRLDLRPDRRRSPAGCGDRACRHGAHGGDRQTAAVRFGRAGRRCGARRADAPAGVGFVALLGVVAAEATQVVGALLLLGLLAAPAAAAHRIAAGRSRRSRSRARWPWRRCGGVWRWPTRSPRCRRRRRSSALAVADLSRLGAALDGAPTDSRPRSRR